MCQSHIELKVTFKRPSFASTGTGSTGTGTDDDGEEGGNNMRRRQHHLQMADLVREVLQDVLPRQLVVENQDVAHIMAFAPDNDNDNDEWNGGGGGIGNDENREGEEGNDDVGGGDGDGVDQRNNGD